VRSTGVPIATRELLAVNVTLATGGRSTRFEQPIAAAIRPAQTLT